MKKHLQTALELFRNIIVGIVAVHAVVWLCVCLIQGVHYISPGTVDAVHFQNAELVALWWSSAGVIGAIAFTIFVDSL